MPVADTFVGEESGAVTVEWVVLTASAVGIAIAVMSSVLVGVETLGTNIANAVTSAAVVDLGGSGAGGGNGGGNGNGNGNGGGNGNGSGNGNGNGGGNGNGNGGGGNGNGNGNGRAF